MQVGDIPLRFGGLGANFLIFTKRLVVEQIIRNGINGLLGQLTEPRLVLYLLSDVILFGLLHFVPKVVHVADVHDEDVTVLVSDDPRVSVPAPPVIDCRIPDNVSRGENCLQNRDCNVIFVGEHVQVTVHNYCALIRLKEQQAVCCHNTKIGFLHHLVERLSAEPVEKSNPLEVHNHIWDFVNEPPLLPDVVFCEIYHHDPVVLFQELVSLEMAIDVDPPPREPWPLYILKSQVLKVELLYHLFVVRDLMLSLHHFRIRFESQSIVFDFSMAQSPHIHNVCGDSIILFGGLINVELVLAIIVLRTKDLVLFFSLWCKVPFL